MPPVDCWTQACDIVVGELLDQARLTAPPIDALTVGQCLQMALVWDAAQAGRGRLLRHGAEMVILLRPDDRPERVQWAAAHELGEALAWKICRLAECDFEDLAPRQREQIANEFARRLLLPTAWFEAAARRCDSDLYELKTRFATASHEMIGWRLLDQPTPRVISVWDQGKLTRRRGNLMGKIPPVTPTEQQVWQGLHTDGGCTDAESSHGRVRGWAIHEPGWRREIVCWEAQEFEDHLRRGDDDLSA